MAEEETARDVVTEAHDAGYEEGYKAGLADRKALAQDLLGGIEGQLLDKLSDLEIENRDLKKENEVFKNAWHAAEARGRSQ